MRRNPCAWVWLHDHPKHLRDTGDPHMCARPPRHPGPHACWCGDKDWSAA